MVLLACFVLVCPPDVPTDIPENCLCSVTIKKLHETVTMLEHEIWGILNLWSLAAVTYTEFQNELALPT